MASGGFPVVLTIIVFYIFRGEADNAVSSKPRYVSRGESVTLGPPGMLMTGRTPTDILWTHDKNKAVEWEEGNPGDPAAPPVYREYNRFNGTVALNTATGELTVRGLTAALSGLYEIEYTVDKRLHRHSELVEVLEPASKPDITCERSNNSAATLRCSAAQGSQLQYRWSGPGLSKKQQESGGTVTTTEEGVYTCEVKNPVSRERRDFNTTTECGKNEPGNQPPKSNGAVVGTLVTLAIVVIGAIGVIWFKCFRNKTCCSGTDPSSPEVIRDESSSPAVGDKGNVNPHYASEKVPLLESSTFNDDPQTKDDDNNGQRTHEVNGTPLESGTRDDVSSARHTLVPEGARDDVPQRSPVAPPKPPRLSLHVSNKDPTPGSPTGGEEGEGRGEQTPDEGRDDCGEDGGGGRRSGVDAGGEAEEDGMVSELGKGGQVTAEDASELMEVRVASGRGDGVTRAEGSERQNGTEDAAGDPWPASEESLSSASAPVSPDTRVPCPSAAGASEEQIREEEGEEEEEDNTEEGRGEADRMEEGGEDEREEEDREELYPDTAKTETALNPTSW